ncbi:MAG: alpha/beta hydrolase domain-containing protein, partial [Methylocystis sp.]
LLGFIEAQFSQSYVQNAEIFDGVLAREIDLEPLRAFSTPIIHFWGEDAYWRSEPWRIVSRDRKNIRQFFISGEMVSSLLASCRKDQSPSGMMAAQKALLIMLYAWVRGETPPASRAPGPRDLILAKDVIWPDIGVRPKLPGDDRLVPRIDHDGNTHSGLLLPNHILPIATTLSFSINQQGSEGSCPARSVMPFSPDKAAREKSHDPRQSLVERYGSRTYFVATMRVVAEKLVKEKLLLRQDAESYVRAAKDAPF